MNPVEDEDDWFLMLFCPDEPLVGFPFHISECAFPLSLVSTSTCGSSPPPTRARALSTTSGQFPQVVENFPNYDKTAKAWHTDPAKMNLLNRTRSPDDIDSAEALVEPLLGIPFGSTGTVRVPGE